MPLCTTYAMPLGTSTTCNATICTTGNATIYELHTIPLSTTYNTTVYHIYNINPHTINQIKVKDFFIYISFDDMNEINVN